MPLFSGGESGSRREVADDRVRGVAPGHADMRNWRRSGVAGPCCLDGYTQCRRSWPRARHESGAAGARTGVLGMWRRGWPRSNEHQSQDLRSSGHIKLGVPHPLRVQCARTRAKSSVCGEMQQDEVAENDELTNSRRSHRGRGLITDAEIAAKIQSELGEFGELDAAGASGRAPQPIDRNSQTSSRCAPSAPRRIACEAPTA
jgi:hypothetical protein